MSGNRVRAVGKSKWMEFNYEVTYQTDLMGVVLYTVKEISDYQGTPEYVYVPVSERSPSGAILPVVIPAGIGAGGGKQHGLSAFYLM